MLGADEPCFIPHLIEGWFHRTLPNSYLTQNAEPGLVSKTSLIWESVDNPDLRLDSRTLMVKSSFQRWEN
jgi:cation-transporting ATPase 13A3/4/5